MASQQNADPLPSAEEIQALNSEFAKDARAKMYWIYRTRNTKELKVYRLRDFYCAKSRNLKHDVAPK